MASKSQEACFDAVSKKDQPPPNSFYVDVLDTLGYSVDLLNKRSLIYDNAAKCLTKVANRNWQESTNVVVPGSRGEGIAVSWKSDLDMIFVQPAVKCFEQFATVDPEVENNCVASFELDLENAPDGYTKLLLKGEINPKIHGPYRQLIRNLKLSLTEDNYLKSGMRIVEAVEYGGEDLKKEGWISENYKFEETTGPAQPVRFPLPFPDTYLSLDLVQAFPCVYPAAYDKFLKRRRNNTWPSTEVLNAVKESDIYVVSVGMKDSEEESLQWRLSFTQAEITLVRSFNDTQIKVYAAMKMLVKKELQPICANITSYMVKNVIFWVFEERSGSFERDNFSDIILQSIIYLKDCLLSGVLNNYMIPSRNLLREKFTEEETRNVLEHLDVLIEEGVSALLRCPLIQTMSVILEEDLENALKFRDLTDKLLLAIFALEPNIYEQIEHSCHTAQSADQVKERYFSQVLPIIRKLNPFDFFTSLITMDNAEIVGRLQDGLQRGYDKLWMD